MTTCLFDRIIVSYMNLEELYLPELKIRLIVVRLVHASRYKGIAREGQYIPKKRGDKFYEKTLIYVIKEHVWDSCTTIP